VDLGGWSGFGPCTGQVGKPAFCPADSVGRLRAPTSDAQVANGSGRIHGVIARTTGSVGHAVRPAEGAREGSPRRTRAHRRVSPQRRGPPGTGDACMPCGRVLDPIRDLQQFLHGRFDSSPRTNRPTHRRGSSRARSRSATGVPTAPKTPLPAYSQREVGPNFGGYEGDTCETRQWSTSGGGN